MKYEKQDKNNRFHHYKIGERVKVNLRDYLDKTVGHFDDGSGRQTLGNRIWTDGQVIGYNGLHPVVKTECGKIHIATSSRFKVAYNNDIRPYWYVSKWDKEKNDKRSGLAV